LLSGLVLLSGGAIAYFQSSEWVGYTDLRIRFIVTDIETGESVPEAVTHLKLNDDALYGEPMTWTYAISPDKQGKAELLCRNCLCSGVDGLFQNTFDVKLPPYWLSVSAPNYVDSEWTELSVVGNRKRVKQCDSGSMLDVLIHVQKSRAAAR
jgi:hypothetical protein